MSPSISSRSVGLLHRRPVTVADLGNGLAGISTKCWLPVDDVVAEEDSPFHPGDVVEQTGQVRAGRHQRRVRCGSGVPSTFSAIEERGQSRNPPSVSRR
ncbi:hypothetical protein EUA04_25450 [Mycolicibacterium obuense]|uniref:Uncharacterized protein n=1 Tax=Mycolicibacterium obuense TaxID=1807 RepID=A0A0M2JXY5_9MYCO|nr:hypothetical protein [Mycolicibacterium obuense]KKF01942.1 hypothetical protein WN67_11065 [Mycolicibacterium obuense]TDL03599.1 hypothetical protein EUA04_25450 [Mycolicibacterium obuense]